MGKEKRLFLLAVMTVMMSTVGYGGTHKEFKQDKDNPNKVQEIQEPAFSVPGSDIGYKLMTGKSDKDKTTVISSTDITITKDTATGIQLFLGKETKGKNKFTNKGTITVNSGVGVALVKTENTDNPTANEIATNTFINDGTIKVAGGKGIQLDNEKDVVTNNNEIIVDKDTNGVGVSMSAGNFTNNETGKITVGKGGTGIEQSGGKSTNNGKITVSSAIGVKLSNGTSTNNGIIDVISGTGVEITGGTFTNEKDGEIKVSTGQGVKSLGGTTINNGKITVNGGVGVFVKNSTFTNNKEIIVSTANDKSGINMSDKGIVNNNGLVSVQNGTGINQGQGTLDNNGKIDVTNGTGVSLVKGTFNNNGSGENGLHVSGSGNVGIKQTGGTGNNNGLIKVTDGATGIELSSNGKFINNSEIVITKGTGAEVLGGTFTNENNGVITVTGKDNIGINQSGGTVENLGTINVQNQGTGIIISKDGGLGRTAGTINVSGEGSTGIRVNQGTKNTINYNGIIDVKQGTGVEVLGGTFITKKTILVQEGTGIKLSDGAVNNSITGKIDVQGQGTGVDITGGKFTNKNIVNVGKGNGTGVKVDGGKFINEKRVGVYSGIGVNVINGEFINKKNINTETKEEDAIYVSAGTGINIEKDGKVLNEGKINVAGGNGIGVALNDSMFVNSGEIFGKGTAIQSIKGNNTVYLKNGSSVAGKIVGADGIDVLGLEKGTYSDLDISNYEAITVRDGIVIVKDSTIELEYNKGTKEYLEQAKKDMDEYDSKNKKAVEEKKLTMSNSNLIIDFKDSLTNPNGPNGENPIIDVGTDGKLTFGEGMKIDFSSSDNRDVFNLNEALGLGKDQIVIEGNFDDVFKDTAVWEYDNSTGEITLKKNKYEDVVLKSELKEFAGIFGNKDNFNKDYKDTISNILPELNLLDTKGEFTNVMAQMSGGVHGYIVDFAALNARTLTNTMRNRALTRDYMRKRPLNSWIQDVSYIDNNHRLGGLMDVDYTEKGILGISEKQILPNGRIGLVYGGSKGNAEFEGGKNGSSSLDGIYFGGYYNHEFNNKWSLNSNANFVYTHNKVTRNIDITYKDKDKKEIVNPIFKSAYPTYTVGMGTSLIYTVKDDLRNKAHFYVGVDVERIVVGNINENKDSAKDDTGLAIKTTSYNAKNYYSIVPSAGFMVQNTGYIFDRKYRIGADLNWETEVGNIKDGKRIKLTGLDKEYKVETSERENIFSYSLFGALDLTESLSVNARYTSMFSDEYDADMIGAGFEYKMDTMADNFFGTLAHKLENNRPFSDRWGGTFGLIMETDDVDDYTKYDNGHPTSGDVATSMEHKPKMILSLNDKQSNWSYYFEAYHKTNNMFGSIKSDERESHASRYHGEARWNDTYSKGSYGMSFGYRNENSRKSDYYASNKTREIVKNGTHELRITPSFTYDLGHGFTLGGKSAIVFMYKYEGDRAGQMDMNTESQIGFTYTGFMPRWSIIANFYREDTWYDHSYRKMTKVGNDYFDRAPKNDQVNQLRPSIIYYFGNGASFRFDARIPLGNGSWANLNDGTNGNQAYETRYGFNYYYPVTPGLTVNVGGTFLNTKTKNKDHSSDKYGNITRGYAFRPNIGFYYSF